MTRRKGQGGGGGGEKEEEGGGGSPIRVGTVSVCTERDVPIQEEGADLTDFAPAREDTLFRKVFRDLLHHKKGLYLDRGVLDDDVCQSCWRRLAMQLARWYARNPGEVGHRFTEILAKEW